MLLFYSTQIGGRSGATIRTGGFRFPLLAEVGSMVQISMMTKQNAAPPTRLQFRQRGRAGMQFLGSLQSFTGSDLRACARRAFEGDADGQSILARWNEPSNESWETRIAEAREVAERAMSYGFERLYQRYVAEEIYVRALPAVDEKRDEARSYMQLPYGARAGTLELDPDFKIPEYFDGVEWHLMPGGWDSYELMSVVMVSGASPYVFKRGGWAAVEVGDDNFQQRIDVAKQFPKKHYRRIYEPGSGGSHTLCMLHKFFPEAELVGSDVSPYLLRGGHLTAEKLGIPVHLKQRDARNTREHDASVDAVICYALFHEMPVDVGRDTLREMYRILEPGGDIVICDIPPFHAVHPFQAVVLDWETENRDEPFFSSTRAVELADTLREIGFDNVEAYPLGKQGYPYIQRARKPLTARS